MKPQVPTHSPALHHTSLATITCPETHRSNHVSHKNASESQATLPLLYCYTLYQFRKSCHRALWKCWVITHKILLTFSTFSEQVSHFLSLTGKLSLNMILPRPTPVGVNFSPTTLIYIYIYLCGRCPPVPHYSFHFIFSSVFVNLASFKSNIIFLPSPSLS